MNPKNSRVFSDCHLSSFIGNTSKLSLPLDTKSIHFLEPKSIPNCQGNNNNPRQRSRSQFQFVRGNQAHSKENNEFVKREERSLSGILEENQRSFEFGSLKRIREEGRARNNSITTGKIILHERTNEPEAKANSPANSNSQPKSTCNDVSNLQTQIKEIEKLKQSEQRKFRIEIDRLTQASSKAEENNIALLAQIDGLKSQLNELSTERSKSEKPKDYENQKVEHEKLLSAYRSLHTDYLSTKTELTSLKSTLNSERIQYYTADSQKSELTKELVNLKDVISNLRGSLEEREEMLFEAAKQKDMIYDCYNEEKVERLRVAKQNKILESKLSQLTEQLNTTQNLNSQFQDEKSKLQISFDSLKSTTNSQIQEKNEEIFQLKEKIENFDKIAFENLNENANLKSKISNLETKFTNLNFEIEKLSSENANLECKLIESNEESMKLQSILTKGCIECPKINEKLFNLDLTLKEATNRHLIELQNKKSEIENIQSKLQTKETQISTLTILNGNLEIELTASKSRLVDFTSKHNSSKRNLEIENATLVDSLSATNTSIQQQESKITKLNEELTRFKDLHSKSANEIEFLNSELNDFKRRHSQCSTNQEKANEYKNLLFEYNDLIIKDKQNYSLIEEYKRTKECLFTEISNLKSQLDSRNKENSRSHEIKEKIMLEIQKEILILKRDNEQLANLARQSDKLKEENIILKAKLDDLNQWKSQLDQKAFKGHLPPNLIESNIFEVANSPAIVESENENSNNSLENTKIEVYTIFEDANNGLGNSLLLSKDFTTLKETISNLKEVKGNCFVKSFQSPTKKFTKSNFLPLQFKENKK